MILFGLYSFIDHQLPKTKNQKEKENVNGNYFWL